MKALTQRWMRPLLREVIARAGDPTLCCIYGSYDVPCDTLFFFVGKRTARITLVGYAPRWLVEGSVADRILQRAGSLFQSYGRIDSRMMDSFRRGAAIDFVVDWLNGVV